MLRSQRLCSTPALLFCHLTFVDNLHTHFIYFNIVAFSRLCCCLEVRICFAAKWHRALGKCVKILWVRRRPKSLERLSTLSTTGHRGQVCMCVWVCTWTLSKYWLICSYLFLSLAIAYAKHVSSEVINEGPADLALPGGQVQTHDWKLNSWPARSRISLAIYERMKLMN